ncbi:LCP family glycopolymer transferase [Salimicrobium flavidum]|uniref:Transcriptional attenuator, LytR family n=1 Tax=Salimicrobium flavidum TaxID=570947 RepID=A0A1N7KN48_9BACI|nr:LCP family protein [Salimicrobium flavidum]SIS62916.1 transcriptional attenuator, LytR family [Salimicrobium flavidum]
MKKKFRSSFKQGKWWKIPLLLILLLSFGTSLYFFLIYQEVKGTVNERMQEDIPAIEHSVTKKKLDRKAPLNVLLMGVDKRSNDRGRSDAIMVLTLEPSNDRSQLISIPRDTRTTLVGEGEKNGVVDKINHAYAFGGPGMTVSTVEHLLEIEVDYYVKINMEGLVQMVDTVGGITVYNSMEWTGENGFHYRPGELALNGEEALQFVRMRYEDPEGDAGRNNRQREVIQGILDEGAKISSINKAEEIIGVLGDNVTMNMDFATVQELLMHYRNTRNNMTTYQMEGTGTMINGIYYLQMSDEEIQQVHERITAYNPK